MRFLAVISFMTKAAHSSTARRLSRLVLAILAVTALGAVPATAMAKPGNG
jgi:hypothetical protein